MAKRKVSMRKLNDVLRLTYTEGLPQRAVADSCGLSVGAINGYIQAFRESDLAWPLPLDLSEEDLWKKLNLPAKEEKPPSRPYPDLDYLHKELRRKGVTLKLLWQEYRREYPEGYGYSQFCSIYGRYRKRLDPVMRQHHEPGRKMFVDWAGQKVDIHDRFTGEVHQASIFVAALGASNYTYVEAFGNEKLPSWICAHTHAYEFFEGVPKITTPDNPKTGVIRASRYEALLNRTYEDMAEHYNTVIIPARPGKPRDKAKVETAVLIAERWILARLRNHKFFSLAALNDMIVKLLREFNTQPFQQMDGCRKDLYEQEEKAVLRPLPQQSYKLASFLKAKVNIDYHITVKKHHYSVPYKYIHREVTVRLTESTIEIFCDGKRIAAHIRSWKPGQFTTLGEHRPKAHRKHLEWTPSRMISWAENSVGTCCAQVVEQILKGRPHPEQGFRSCMGIIRLAKALSPQRVEQACRRALHYQTCSYQSIKSILENGLDRQEPEETVCLSSPDHENIRGRSYYQNP